MKYIEIKNEDFYKEEREVIEFFLNQDSIIQKEIVIDQINRAQIRRDRSPYFLIMDFDMEESDFQKLNFDYPFVTSLQVLHKDGSAPTCFILFAKNGRVKGIELFNADSSEMVYGEMCKGDVTFL